EGAKAVNVIGQQRNDIYGKVAEVANAKLLARDYDRYLTYSNSVEDTVLDLRPTADSLAGKINRNITKSNTMTQPYSVTVRGMQDQLKILFTEYENIGKKFWIGEPWVVSKILADVHQRSIDEVVQGAKRGKDFIKAITAKVASRNKGLLYTTPMGFTVYQKNVMSEEFRIDSTIWTPNKGSQRVQFRVKRKVGRVNTSSQKNSSAPNLIHGCDTSLLNFTVRRCKVRNIKSYSLIHDSYGVHPNKVPILNEEVREAFIEIFSEDVLYNWAIEVLENAGFTFDEILGIFSELDDPMLNTLNLNDVRDATFMFS
ncbi:MAG: DNA-directed RNA polymerase, partial [Paraclostridium sp.]